MPRGLHALTERERETLRLLLRGHDAKSIARAQGLSVHTVNERLREARRKLGVSSSREAARMLVRADLEDPEFLADEHLGVAADAADMRSDAPPDRPARAGHRLAWFGGGMLIMSLIIAAFVLSSSLHVANVPDGQGAKAPPPAAVAPSAADAPAVGAARDWLALLDGQRWEESWRKASPLFSSKISAAEWASTAQSLRQPLGQVRSRSLLTVTRTGSLPGAPAGEYEVTQFQTDFAHRDGAVETIILAREGGAWRVAGYFMR
jgi:DNA-binding CsgD family transcriptional regulator